MTSLNLEPLNLIITGVGGQGNVLISQVLARALVGQGLKTTVGETFGLSQRGGSVQSHVRVSRNKIFGPLIPEGQAHAVLGLEPLETLRVMASYGQPDIQVLVNARPVQPLNVIAGQDRYPADEALLDALRGLAAKVWWLNATAEAQGLGAAIMANIVMLGALTATGIMPVEAKDLEEALAEVLADDRLEQNLAAFRRGLELID
ncbi:MAG: indolepyruvate oxidoreductase subunit beta [Proteobacteria bacterium]|nr:indolepyruvate oxidoreductase subunit beta [Pseudomonadota bacterium]